jgi:AcrR family transcriptional regulator
MKTQSMAVPKISTRERILDAAVLRFSRNSYEETGLRDIAADVGVDVAYVHRCFGSKAELFAEAVAVTIRAEELLSGEPARLAHTLAKQLFTSDGSQPEDGPGKLDIIIHSLTSPAATSILREFIMNDFIKPLSAKLDQPTVQKAAFVTALITGLGIMRNVLQMDPLLDDEGGELESYLTTLLKTIMASA